MNFILQPWHLLLIVSAGWINREQQAIIASATTELATKIATRRKGGGGLSFDNMIYPMCE